MRIAKRKRGRPKKQENISGLMNVTICLDKDTHSIVKSMSDSSERTFSGMIRHLLKKGIETTV